MLSQSPVCLTFVLFRLFLTPPSHTAAHVPQDPSDAVDAGSVLQKVDRRGCHFGRRLQGCIRVLMSMGSKQPRAKLASCFRLDSRCVEMDSNRPRGRHERSVLCGSARFPLLVLLDFQVSLLEWCVSIVLPRSHVRSYQQLPRRKVRGQQGLDWLRYLVLTAKHSYALSVNQL